MLAELEAAYDLPSDQELAEFEAFADPPWNQDLDVWLAEFEAIIGPPSDTVSVIMQELCVSDPSPTETCADSRCGSSKSASLETPPLKVQYGQLHSLADRVLVDKRARVREKPAWRFWCLSESIQGPSYSGNNKVP